MKQWPSQKVCAVGVILGHFNAMLRYQHDHLYFHGAWLLNTCLYLY